MDRFEYVMVLVSIIVGLSIAHMLVGVAGLIDRKASGREIRLSWAHSFWLGYVFLWTVQFWWWEFRFSEIVTEWTVGLYLFLVTYAITLFLIAAILVPRRWDSVKDLDEFFLERRVWFYWILLWGTLIDVVDGLLKGGSTYIIETLGWSIWPLWIAIFSAIVIGLRSRRAIHHA
ncbi:MAG: hypothetical protein P8008_06830, partial [Gammaproteobacteria bacterium]